MNIAQIEANLQNLIATFEKSTFIYNLLLAYGLPKSAITRLQKGDLNLSKNYGEIIWKKKLFFKVVTKEEVHEVFKLLNTDSKARKHEPRFIIVTDLEVLLAIDTKTNETLDIEISNIVKYYDFFLPWAGMEKTQYQSENPADVKAAERMAKLYDEIKKNNTFKSAGEVHSLNVFLSRLLFCFFAEDTGIFKKGQFTNAVASHTQEDGNDLSAYLHTLFNVLNTEDRNNLPAYLAAFPYVNGGLFRDTQPIPAFTRRSRQLIIECGQEDWSAINPDIFGSMIQAVITPEHRGGLGMHYTSVPNIMKVIEPLFLNELYEEFEAAKYQPLRLNRLLERLSRIRIFDPACGSGNFLIIAYKELRLFEMKVLQRLKELQSAVTGFEEKQLSLIPKQQQTLAANFQLSLFSRIELSQFYGIELDDFAHEIAILSLWLAEHQMNVKFKETMGQGTPSLPLRAGGNIVHGNATRINWEAICPKVEDVEIYILGNPPYLGARLLDEKQKADMKFVLHGKIEGYNDLDYISCWFFKGANYIRGHRAQCAFVSTNSICQGSQVATLWPKVLSNNLEIGFVHQSFKWTNSAKANAAVIVVIIGIRNIMNKSKWIFDCSLKKSVKNISPYLIESDNVFVFGRREPLSSVPPMNFGSMPNDGGHLILTDEDYNSAISKEPGSKRFIKRLVGSKEFINDIRRWCIWIKDEDLEDARRIEFINERINKVFEHRSASDREATNLLASVSHRFAEVRHQETNSIIIPRHSSERRDYIPIGFLSPEEIIADSALAIYGAEPWHFGVINSRMHMTWIRAVGGRIKSDYRYSAAICYNTFPLPNINKHQKHEIEKSVFYVLEERENHSEKNLAQLYDPEKMPAGLKQAHRQLDITVEQCYRNKPFESDDERLEYLFKLYEQMIAEEKVHNGEMTFEQSKSKKKKSSYA